MTDGKAAAQAFFAPLVNDPAVGVDRGGALLLRPVQVPTRFATADNFGARDIGPLLLGFGLALPNLATRRDQLDIVAAMAGPSANGGRELFAGGATFRIPLGAAGTDLFVAGDFGDFILGAPTSLQLGLKGYRGSAQLGLRRIWQLPGTGRLTTTASLVAREEYARSAYATLVDETIRMLRLSARYDAGELFGFQRRLLVSLAQGLDGFGASTEANRHPSAPGVTPQFLRLAFGAEASVPIVSPFLVNLGVIGQWTVDSLPISQRCGYGTNAYARGFDLSYVNGDRCLGGRVELALDLWPPEADATTLFLSQAFLGVDGGVIEDSPNQFQPGDRDTWSSVSLGWRARRNNVIGEIALTHILDDPPGFTPQGATRFWFRFGVSF